LFSVISIPECCLIKLCGKYIWRKLNTIGKEKMKIIDYIEPIGEEAFMTEVLLKSGAPLCHPNT